MELGFYSVGSLPFATAKEALAFQQKLTAKGIKLWAYVGGEATKPNWLVNDSQRIARLAGIPLNHIFTGLAYPHFGARLALGTVYKHRVNAYIRSHGVPLDYANTAREEYDLFAASGANGRFMVGLPTPFALAFMSGITGHENLRAFEASFAEEIRKILAIDNSIVIQWEMPIELALASLLHPIASRRQKWLQSKMDSVGRVMSAVDSEASWTVHLCNGDLKHRPALPGFGQSPRVRVELINAFTQLEVWQTGHTLEAIHEPHGDGKHLQKLSPKDLQVYSLLTCRPNTYAVGLNLAATVDPEEIAQELRAMRNVLQDVPTMDGNPGPLTLLASTPCGLGRTPVAEVDQEFDLLREVNQILDSTEER